MFFVSYLVLCVSKFECNYLYKTQWSNYHDYTEVGAGFCPCVHVLPGKTLLKKSKLL